MCTNRMDRQLCDSVLRWKGSAHSCPPVRLYYFLQTRHFTSTQTECFSPCLEAPEKHSWQVDISFEARIQTSFRPCFEMTKSMFFWFILRTLLSSDCLTHLLYWSWLAPLPWLNCVLLIVASWAYIIIVSNISATKYILDCSKPAHTVLLCLFNPNHISALTLVMVTQK